MDSIPDSYAKEYARSMHHAVIGLLTVGLGFMMGHPLPLILGVTVYGLSWLYVPDMGFFRAGIDARRAAVKAGVDAERVAEFLRRRDALLISLARERRVRYELLSAVCLDIEGAGADSSAAAGRDPSDLRMRRLDELMWTFLRLLSIEETMEKFLETERREDVPAVLRDAEAEMRRITEELKQLEAQGPSPALESRTRYMNSRLERLEVLRKRQERLQQGKDNLDLVLAEQERLEQQIKLIRADAIATKNSDALSAKIDATVSHLETTNQWLSELDQFKDLSPELPHMDARVGHRSSAEPLLTAEAVVTPRRSSRSRQPTTS
jgi:hypothetical protein